MELEAMSKALVTSIRARIEITERKEISFYS